MAKSETDHPHADEPHGQGISGRLNWLRAGVLGANDGIVSVAAIVVGVAAATSHIGTIVTAGLAALIGGAISMALGEYVSVSTQRDSEHALIEKEKDELERMPAEELDELTGLYLAQGLSPETARTVAEELTAKDALRAHLHAELNINPDDIVSPWHAAFASAIAFTVGAILPMLAILAPEAIRIPLTFGIVLVALAVTGGLGARLGGAGILRGTVRVLIGGVLALGATFLIGMLLNTTGVTA